MGQSSTPHWAILRVAEYVGSGGKAKHAAEIGFPLAEYFILEQLIIEAVQARLTRQDASDPRTNTKKYSLPGGLCFMWKVQSADDSCCSKGTMTKKPTVALD